MVAGVGLKPAVPSNSYSFPQPSHASEASLGEREDPGMFRGLPCGQAPCPSLD